MPAMGCRQRDLRHGECNGASERCEDWGFEGNITARTFESLDAEDYFELACEADEFGVHILSYSVAE